MTDVNSLYWCDICEGWQDGDPEYDDLPSGIHTITVCGSCALEHHIKERLKEIQEQQKDATQ